MTNYREILRLNSLQYSQRTIESMAHCSRHTVRDVLQAAKEQGISWPLPADVTNAELEQLLFPNKHKASSQYAEPDYPYIHAHPAQAGGRHAGGLGWRYHPPPGPGHGRAKRRLHVTDEINIRVGRN